MTTQLTDDKDGFLIHFISLWRNSFPQTVQIISKTMCSAAMYLSSLVHMLLGKVSNINMLSILCWFLHDVYQYVHSL